MDNLNIKNINDEKVFNVVDPNGQGEITNRIRPVSISISQEAETINDNTESTVGLSVYWNDTWKSILDLEFNDTLRQEYGKLVTDLTAIQKDIDMKQYKDAETKTADFLKYVTNISAKYTQIPEQNVQTSADRNEFVTVTANADTFKVKVSDRLLNFMLKKYAKVKPMPITGATECFSINSNYHNQDVIDIYYHSPALFEKQSYMTVVKNQKPIGTFKATYDDFSKFASKLALTPQTLGYSRDKMAGYTKTAEVVMQNIFFDNVDEAKEWQEMVDEKKKEQTETEDTDKKEELDIDITEKPEKGKGGASPVKEDGGLAGTDESFAATDELPEAQPQQQEQSGGQQGMAASRRLKLLKKRASYQKTSSKRILNKRADETEKLYTFDELSDKAKDRIRNTLFDEEGNIVRQAKTSRTLRKKALYGDVQEADIVVPNADTAVYVRSQEEPTEDTLAIGDTVTVAVDTLCDNEEYAKYEAFAGQPAILMEVDIANIDNVIIEKIEYPYERTVIEKDKVVVYDEVANTSIVVEDEPGDEVITTVSHLPQIAASCKIKSIRKATRLRK